MYTYNVDTSSHKVQTKRSVGGFVMLKTRSDATQNEESQKSHPLVKILESRHATKFPLENDSIDDFSRNSVRPLCSATYLAMRMRSPAKRRVHNRAGVKIRQNL